MSLLLSNTAARLRPPAFRGRRLLPVALALGLLQGGCGRVDVASVPEAPFSCKDESWNAASVNPLRFIAHAGGEIDGLRYTNSREALELAYEKGLRLFEFDLIKTVDGQLVAAHDWDHWREATGSLAKEPSHREFKERLLFGKYRTLDLHDLEQWFGERTDSYLVTDKVEDFKSLTEGFTYKDRLIVEVFSVADYHRALDEGVLYPMLSLGAALAHDSEDEILDLVRTQPVKFAAVATKTIKRVERLLAGMRHNETCVYAFTSSEPRFLNRNLGNLVYGVYTDGWDVRAGSCAATKCDTY